MSALDRVGLYRRPPDARPVAEVDADIREELAFHIAERERELIASGAAPDDAARAARRGFGDVEQVVAACREIELKERIMLQRINFALTLVALTLLGVFLWRAEDGRAATLSGFGAIEAELASLRTTVIDAPARGAALPSTPDVVAPGSAETWVGGHAPTRPVQIDALGLQLPPPRSAPDRRSMVFVLGKVKRPGAVEWSKRLTLTMLIAECGGLEEFASTKSIRVIRGSNRGREIIDVDLDEVLAGKRPDVELEKGDQVHVPESFF